MKNSIKFIILLIFISNYSFAQSNKEIALEKAKEAILLMDNGKIEESISLLQESQKLDPENFDYPYEIAYANYLKKDYKKAIEILEKLENYQNKNERLYTLWGNSYDILENSKKAIEIYDKGILKFPNKGLLYLEKGVVYEFEKDNDKAIETYKIGISVEPKFPSNYYRLANLFLNSTNTIPGLIYGEIFVNLERTTNRTKEMSKSLFETYKKAITVINQNEKKVDFCNEVVIDAVKYEKDKKFPICMIFGKHFIMGIMNVNEINLETLSEVRKSFLKTYFEQDYKNYPNILFEYQQQMNNKNIFDAYNHYIFQMGAQNEFSDWLKNHETEYNKFVEWYTKDQNILSPTNENYWNFTN